MSKPLNIYRLHVAAIVSASVEPADCPWEWRGSGCYDVDVYNIELWQMDIVAVHEDMAKFLAGQEVLWNPPHGTTEDWKVFSVEGILLGERKVLCHGSWRSTRRDSIKSRVDG